MTSIGFHVSVGGNRTGIGQHFQALDAAGIPVFLVSIGDYGPINEVVLLARASGIDHRLVFRVTDLDVPNYGLDPATAALNHWTAVKAKLPPEFDKQRVWLCPINEVDKNRADWLGHFATNFAASALGEGYKVTMFGWSSGEPEPEHWQTAGMRRYLELCAANPNKAAVALHEYSYTIENLNIGYPSLIGRFQSLFAACDQMGITRPTVHITEFGWTHEEVPTPDVAMPQLDWAYKLYTPYPQIKGVAIWGLISGFGGIASLAQKLIAPVTEYMLNAPDVDPIEPPPVDPPNPQPSGKVVTTTTANIRRVPSTSGNTPIGTVPAGTVFEQVDESGNWYGVKVWVSKDVADPVDEEIPPPVEPPPLPHVDRPVGVDVSHHQGVMNWAKAKAAGAWYAFIKATQRTNWTDPRFLINWQEAKTAGLLIAPYHYFQPGYDPIQQADYFVNTVKATGRNSDLPYVLDVEEGGSAAGFSDKIKACLNRIQQLTGRKPLLYCGIYYANHYLKTVTPNDADLWIANWVDKPDPYMPTAWNHWFFWQYTSSGNGPQYGAQSARIDLNRWNGTLSTLYQYAGSTSPPPIDPPPGNPIDLRRFKIADPDAWRVVRNPQGAQEDIQDLELGGGVFVRRKNQLAEWHKRDDVFFYLIHDTSPSPGMEGVERVYTLYKVGIPGAPKSRIMQAVGETWTELGTHYVQFRAKDDCRTLSENSGNATNSSVITRYATNYTFNTYAQNLTLDEVIFEQTGQETQIYGRHNGKSIGWCGWIAPWGSAEIVELHWDRGRMTSEPARYCGW